MASGLKVMLVGFDLEPVERAIVDNIITSYSKKMTERASCDSLQLRLRKKQHGKTFLHEIEGKLRANGAEFNSHGTDYNLFAAVDAVLEKILNEIVHKQRTKRQ